VDVGDAGAEAGPTFPDQARKPDVGTATAPGARPALRRWQPCGGRPQVSPRSRSGSTVRDMRLRWEASSSTRRTRVRSAVGGPMLSAGRSTPTTVSVWRSSLGTKAGPGRHSSSCPAPPRRARTGSTLTSTPRTNRPRSNRLLGLGAQQADIGQGAVPWVVLRNPEGNEFCVLEPRE
jgi:hypothetical protein